MNSQDRTPDAPRPPLCQGAFSWRGLLLVLVMALLFGAFFAWIAEEIQAYFSPLLLFPLIFGAFVGLSIVGLIRLTHVGHRRTILIATLLAGIFAAVGQHAFVYANAYYWSSPQVAGSGAMAGQDISSLVRQVRPSFGEFLTAQTRQGRPLLLGHVAYGWVVWLTWGVDALLVVVGSLAVVLPALRIPYCNRCQTWYRTVRQGRIDLPTAKRLAESFGVESVRDSHSPRYRLSACEEGCGPTRCELSWEDRDGAVSLATVWLDAAKRNEVTKLLDGLEGTPVET